MIIIGQNGKSYDVYSLEFKMNKIKCRDNSDRRKKIVLGEYESVERTGEVYREIMNCVDGYYEMPER